MTKQTIKELKEWYIREQKILESASQEADDAAELRAHYMEVAAIGLVLRLAEEQQEREAAVKDLYTAMSN